MREIPAKLTPPFAIKVDDKKWNALRGNINLPSRKQSHDKNEEIRRQCELLLKLKVITYSKANRYSQVHLVEKQQSKTWRMCIDYVLLNSVCDSEGWNLPNIKELLDRLGRAHPHYFAVMDLTSRYHQAPLEDNSRKYTAFMTFMGIFEWTRVPMGLKGAASYFQMVLATIVLVGLMYISCELYIDDIIVHGSDETNFINNLRAVFIRLRNHNVTLNPKKCKFGLESVEYVGHTIDRTGIHFSREKLDKVAQITKPLVMKELRSFLGLASWFRDHIPNFAAIAKPLYDMLGEYETKRKLTWHQESEQAFENLKLALNNCPKLFFYAKRFTNIFTY